MKEPKFKEGDVIYLEVNNDLLYIYSVNMYHGTYHSQWNKKATGFGEVDTDFIDNNGVKVGEL